MKARSDVSTCANPECTSKFNRLGDGELFVFHLSNPKSWGLPPETKQKVFWLCDRCRSDYHVRLDRRHHIAQVVHKPGIKRRVA